MCAMGDKNPLELTFYMRYYHLFDNIFSHPVLVLGGCPVICRWSIIIEWMLGYYLFLQIQDGLQGIIILVNIIYSFSLLSSGGDTLNFPVVFLLKN